VTQGYWIIFLVLFLRDGNINFNIFIKLVYSPIANLKIIGYKVEELLIFKRIDPTRL
jgi:hypothetical protein